MLANNLPTFEEIYSLFKNKVFNTVISYLQNIEDAEETTQDVFVEIHRSIHNFKGESSLSTWIYRISINKSLDFIKSKNRKKRFALLTNMFDDIGNLKHDSPSFYHPGIILENKEKSAILFKAINQLPENQKTAFILSKVEGLSYLEISEVMQTTVSSVESVLFRAKKKLQKELLNFYNS
jgi:RNA polymerase sigma-70 factor (ECF subfamily)